MRAASTARTASTLITLFGVITNSIITLQVFAAWKSLKWDSETEWEASGDNWQLNGLRIIWALVFLYFSSAAAVCTVGLLGVLKNKASYIRFYRDYSIADFSFCALFTAMGTYGAFLGTARAGICEEFSHHPELMRDMFEMGLNLENCERWLERAIFALLAIMFVIMVIRLHFLLAVSNYYSTLISSHHAHHRSSSSSAPKSTLSSLPQTHTMHRIFVLPQRHAYGTGDVENAEGVELVYAPVPRHTLPKEAQDQVAEAWISDPIPRSSFSSSTSFISERHHRRHHAHGSSHHRRRSSASHSTDCQTGMIKLEIKPDEPLLSTYSQDPKV